MHLNFYGDFPYLKNEFEDAKWDERSGLDSKTLSVKFDELLEKHKDIPMPLLRAKALAFLLDNARLEINPRNIFADKIDLGISYSHKGTDNDFLKKQLHEAGPDIMENQMFYRYNRQVQMQEVPEIFEKNQMAIKLGVGRACSDFRHASPDWNMVFKYGFRGILNRALEERRKKEQTGELDEKQVVFYESVILSYEAVLRYLNRLYEASLNYDVPDYTECINHLRYYPPENIYQAMELTFLFTNVAEIGYEKVRTLGLLDQIYEPYYKADLQSGRYTYEEVKEMLRYFFVKWNAARRGAQQPFGLGGVHGDGTDNTNELTYMFLDVYEELNIINPKIHVRCHPDTPSKLIVRVAELIRKGCSSIVLINDEVVCKGYEKIGIQKEEAMQYLPMGCYEPYLMGKEDAMICASWLNIAKMVEFAITGGRDILTGVQFMTDTGEEFTCFEEFLNAYFAQLRFSVEMTVEIIEALNKIAMKINPSPVLSGTMETCLLRGRDIYEGGMKYSNTTIKCFGIATAVDSLLAVKKLVFEDELLTFAELKNVLYRNWDGQEMLRKLILQDNNKYGNNLAEPDELAQQIYKYLAELIIGRPNNRGGVYRLGADSVDFCLTEGEKMGATPDGRLAKEPISKNLCPVSGMQKRGITAFLESVLKIDQTDLLGSAPLDFVVHPSTVQGKDGLKALVAIINTYFAEGGAAIQGNILKAEDLLAAQKEPEKYQDLQIRVCGWNDYFVNLSKSQQQEFIRQAELL